MDIDKNHIETMFKEFGICSEWTEKLQKLTTDEEIVTFYMDNIEFCFENNFPKNRFLLKYRDMFRKNNLFFDETINLTNKQTIGCAGNTSGIILSIDYNVSSIYLKDSANIDFTAKGNSFNLVYVFKGASINISAKERAKVILKDHGGIIKYTTDNESNIKIYK